MDTKIIERAIENAKDEVRNAMNLEIVKRGNENTFGCHENDKEYNFNIATLRKIYDKLEEAINEMPF